MPEGPSIVILKELVSQFSGKKVLSISGNTKIDISWAKDKKVLEFRTWGKHFLICFKGFTIRIHLLLFGSYLINEEKDADPRLSFKFKNGTLNFYSCSVKVIEGPVEDMYDFSADVMSDEWDATAAKKKLKEKPDMLVCDALLDQQIFSGVGNIIKNEALYRIHVHPLSDIKSLPAKKVNELIKEARNYSFDFLEWKKAGTLKKHWLAHTQKICKRCDLEMEKEYLGKTKRRTYYCTNCQVLYNT